MVSCPCFSPLPRAAEGPGVRAAHATTGIGLSPPNPADGCRYVPGSISGPNSSIHKAGQARHGTRWREILSRSIHRASASGRLAPGMRDRNARNPPRGGRRHAPTPVSPLPGLRCFQQESDFRSLEDVGSLKPRHVAGSCCERQWSEPSPSTRSTAWMPTTSRSGNSSARIPRAWRSAGSLNVGTRTAALAM